MLLPDEIMAYYRRGGEHARLASGAGRLEFLRTWDVLVRTLPPAPATVLDVGGAMGVYAGPLAGAGYRVHVVDPVPEHVDAAAQLPGVTAALGDARALAEADASVDAVLLLGPLYHLIDRADRVRAWQEAGRVVRSGGPVVAAAISRFASLLDGFARGFYDDELYQPLVEGALAEGRHHHVPDRNYFTTAYFHHPDEIAGEVADGGLELQRIAGVESPLWMMHDRLDVILDDARRRATLLDMLRTIESDASLLGASSHLLAIARRLSPDPPR
ncbi:MAG TPA: class I SAM-dependent methyltransferase [Micromonosporaceae bacterium]|nr:class I SAM-dependent methyltransferase [Micromonosporaceae bacterium]